jgi:hypothetical protein
LVLSFFLPFLPSLPPSLPPSFLSFFSTRVWIKGLALARQTFCLQPFLLFLGYSLGKFSSFCSGLAWTTISQPTSSHMAGTTCTHHHS